MRKTTRRLADVVVGPAGERAHAVRVADPAAQHDHRHVGIDSGGEPVGSPDAVQQSEAAAVLQAQVEHHQRGLTHLNRA